MQTESDYLWNPAAAPDAEIVRIERALAKFRHKDRPFALRQATRFGVRRRWQVAAALAVAACAVFAALELTGPAPWSVELLAGNARGDGTPLATGARVVSGQRLETDRASTLRIAVGRVGVADLAADSRLELVGTGATEHRLRLARGTLHVTVWAPPRFFVVETPRFTAVDLGCVYSLHVDSGGSSRLGVRQGEVEIQATDRSVLVTAGTVVEIDSMGRAGVPFPVTSTRVWRERLAAVARGDTADSLLTPLLRAPRGTEVISLWHLSARVSPAIRVRIYDVLAPLAPAGAAVRREDVARLDPTAMEQWRIALRPLWSVEPASWWTRTLLRMRLRKPAVRLQFGEDASLRQEAWQRRAG
jgi:hypothetical protein